MSDHSDPGESEFAGDDDLLAGEYALGVLDATEMRALEARAGGHTGLQRAIQVWMARLAPLSFTVSPQRPPDALWARLAAAIGDTSGARADVVVPHAVPVIPHMPAPPAPDRIMPPHIMPLRAPRPQPPLRVAPWRRTGFWQGTTAAMTAIAAGLVAFIIVGPPPGTTGHGMYMGTLMAPNTPMPVYVAHSEPGGMVMVTAMGSPPPGVPNRDMELWALPAGAARPTSLGVMPASGMRVSMHNMPEDQTQLMISLEPSGGSPSGVPTGPVIFAGKLASLN